MNKILVTGGNGFIGTNFIFRAIEYYGLKVVNVDKMTYASNNTIDFIYDTDVNKDTYRKIKNDICNLTVSDLAGVDAVVNIAAESHVDNSITVPMIFEESNVRGTLHLLELTREYNRINNKNIRYLQVSTDEVYGTLKLDEPAFTEQNQIQPNSPYSASKAGADAFVRAYHETYGLDTVITRCSNNFGPHQHNEKFIPKIVENVILGYPIPIYGDGQQIRDWIFVCDHCQAILDVLFKGKSGEVYNVGGDNEMTNMDIIKNIFEIMNKKHLYKDVSKGGLLSYVKDRLGHDRRYAMDHTKLTNEIGWKPTADFKNALNLTIQFIKNEMRENERI